MLTVVETRENKQHSCIQKP